MIREIATPIFQGSLVFGITYGLGALAKAPDKLQGSIISTVVFLGRYALCELADSWEEKYDLKKSERYWLKIGFDTLTLTIVAITTVALGSLNLLGLALLVSVPLILISVDIYQATHLKEDLPLSERIPKKIEKLQGEDPALIEALERRLAATLKRQSLYTQTT